MAVNGLRVELADLPTPLLNEASHLVVAHAESSATFPSGLPCGTEHLPLVAGDAYVVDATTTAPPLVASRVGLVELGSTGGDESAALASLAPVGVGTGETRTNGSLDPAKVTSLARLAKLDLLSGAIRATALEATADSASGSATGNAVIAHLELAGTNICAALGLQDTCTPAADTVLLLDSGRILVVLNEHVGSGGDLRVNAVHVYVLGKGNPLGLPVSAEVVLSSARAATS
jgi:hypothetical protein